MSKTDLIITMLDEINARLFRLEQHFGITAELPETEKDGSVKFTLVDNKKSNILEFPID